MKIRIKGNSLRYRLTKGDMSILEEKGELEEHTKLKKTDKSMLAADFIENRITLFMPADMIAEIIHTDKVGFQNTHGELFLLVEKDFTCLDNIEEDQSDNYPNPHSLNTTK
jgi:hypothetical protein